MQNVTKRNLTRQRGPGSWISCQEGFLHFPFHHLVSSHLLEVSPFAPQKLQVPPQNFQHPSFAPWGFGHPEEVAVGRSSPPPLELEKVRGTPQLSQGSSSCAMTPRTWRRMLPSWTKSLTTWRWTNLRNLICDSLTHASKMKRTSWSSTWTWRIPMSSPWVTLIPICAWRVTCPSSPPCCFPPSSEGRESSSGDRETCSPPRQSKIRYNYLLQILSL